MATSIMKKLGAVLLFSVFLCLPALGQAGKYPSITWDKIRAAGPGLKPIGWLAVKHAKDIKSSPWSVGCETLDRDYADFSVYQNYVGELGVKHARLQSGWAKCEKEKGVYDFAWLDRCVQGLVAQGVAPWISLSYGNPIYRSEKDLGAAIFTDETTMTAWCRYVEATVSRYQGVVQEWEVWNEPRHSESPQAYANLLIRSIAAIKKVQPQATILGFTVHGFSPGVVLKFPRAVLEILKASGKLDIVDYVTYHPYTPNPDDCYPMVEGLRELVHSYNPKIKLYQGESGCPSILEWGHAMTRYPWTEYSQVKWNLRRMAGDRVRDIRSSVFTIIDLRYTSMLQSFGLIRSNLLHEIIYLRPSYYAVQHMVSTFDDTVVPLGELAHASSSPRRMAVGGFQQEGKARVLFWYKDRIPSDDLKWDPTDLRISGISFEDPVYVELASGRVYEIPKGSWHVENQAVWLQQLPVWDSVCMLAERSQVPLRPPAK